MRPLLELIIVGYNYKTTNHRTRQTRAQVCLKPLKPLILKEVMATTGGPDSKTETQACIHSSPLRFTVSWGH